jgi:hypothetical protein
MPQFLLSIYQPDGEPPPATALHKIMEDVRSLHDQMKAAGAWVFTGRLHPAAAAAVVRANGVNLLITDGPFTESKEHIGGVVVIEVPNLDAALAWAGKLAQATTLPIEVRPIREEIRI